MKERLNDLGKRPIEIISVKRREVRQKPYKSYQIQSERQILKNNNKKNPLTEGEEREKGTKRNLFREIIAEDFPNLQKKLNIQDTKLIEDYYHNEKRSYPKYIITMLSKNND